MYVRVTQSGHGLDPGPLVQPRPEGRHQPQDPPGDCGDHSDEQPAGPQQIFAVNI